MRIIFIQYLTHTCGLEINLCNRLQTGILAQKFLVGSRGKILQSASFVVMYNSVTALSDSDGEIVPEEVIPPTQPEAKPPPKPKKSAAKSKPAPESNSHLQ